MRRNASAVTVPTSNSNVLGWPLGRKPTEFPDHLRGVTTDICLIFPSISAVQEGLNVLAVLDASGSSYEVQESMARRRMERAGVVLTTTNTAIAELVQDWSTPQGSELIQLLMATVPKTRAAH